MRAWPATPDDLPSDTPPRSRTRAWLGPLAGLTLLITTLCYVDPSALRGRISQLHAMPIALAAALMFPQLYGLALRWRLTAQLLGFKLSQRHALREYALSVLLNQLLPFGFAGDALRVLRHARGHAALGLSSALHGVVLDRLMGQIVVIGWALATLPLWFGVIGVGFSALALIALLLLARALSRMPTPNNLSTRSGPMRALLLLSLALQRLLASPRYLVSQVLLSSALVLSIVAQLYCALWALGLSLTAAQAAQVFPLMLLSMSVPLSFAGFGPREAVTAQLYSILQLSAADGAAFAMAFGAILICSSLPCLTLVLCLRDADAEPSPR